MFVALMGRVNATDFRPTPSPSLAGTGAATLTAITCLIEALRQELYQYGEVLALLDHQQLSLLSCASGEVWGSMLALQKHITQIDVMRKHRHTCWLELARFLDAEDAASREIILRLPEKYRLPVEALFQENAHLLDRVRARASHNHRLLGQTLQAMKQFLDAIESPALGPVSEPEGASQISASLSHILCEAAV